MGLLQKAVETYDACYEYASANWSGLEMMAPIGHTITKAGLEVSLSRDGRFISASKVNAEDEKTIFPVTEASAGRTSGICPHPLCEQIGYLIPANAKKYEMYLAQLAEWQASNYTHPKLKAVLNYVTGGTVLEDLVRCDLVQVNETGKPKDEKQFVRWRVLDGTAEEACWRDRTLFEAFIGFYTETRSQRREFCMISGENAAAAEQHPKGIVAIHGNAKLISANDENGFTYRGRFDEKRQALTVSYVASQKAHNALRWLVNTQGVYFVRGGEKEEKPDSIRYTDENGGKGYGGRTFLCWNPQGKRVERPTLPMLQSAEEKFKPSDYKRALRDVLMSRKAELELSDEVVLAAFDAGTDGRLSLNYYSEMRAHDFLQRLYDWDDSCCWERRGRGVQSPALWKIVDCAFGNQREEKGRVILKTDDRVMDRQIQRLVSARVDRGTIGADVVQSLFHRASRLGNYDRWIREDILFTACAVIRKHRMDWFKEEWNMALEPERRDRSYQFGRLLAIMEKAERDTYGDDEKREPNAIRMQSVFCQRPLYAANQLEKQLERAYFPRLTPGLRNWYKKMIGQIMEILSTFPEEEWNKSLEDSYLLGYYLQRSNLYTKQTNNETNEAEENEQ